MRIFLTGATGFIGSAIVPDLLAAGYEVVGLARSDEAAGALAVAGAEAHRGDLTGCGKTAAVRGRRKIESPHTRKTTEHFAPPHWRTLFRPSLRSRWPCEPFFRSLLKDLRSLETGAERADAVIHTAFDHDFSRLAENCEMDRQAIEAVSAALAGSDKPLIVTSGLPLTPGRSASEDDVPPAGEHGIPRASEQTAMSLIGRGVRPFVVRMSQVHDQTKQGFGSYLLAHAREKGISAYVGEGLNCWPAVHRLDAARLYRLVLEKGTAGKHYHAVAEEGVPVRAIAEAIGRHLRIPVVAMSPEDSASHFGWLDRIAQMDVRRRAS